MAFAAALLFMVVIPVVLVGALRALGDDNDDADARTPSLRFEVTTPPTDVPHMALSPDGTQLAFVANEDRRPALWLRSLERVETRKLPGTEGAQGPFWSPDGRSIGFFTADKLKRIDIQSGATLVLADIQNGRGADWGPDGTILFAPSVDSPIMRVPSGGGEVTQITTPVGRTAHRSPQFLEDGKRFVFFVGLGTADVNGTYIGFLDRSPPKRILSTQAIARFAQPGHLITVRQGALVAYQFGSSSGSITGEPAVLTRGLGEDTTGDGAFAVSNAGVLAYRFGGRQRRQLQWVNRQGLLLGSIGEPRTDSIGSPELSPDERAITLFLGGRGGNDIGVIDLVRNLPRFITNTPPADAHPLWDPDGRHVAYVSARIEGYNGPVRQAIDGTGQPTRLFAGNVQGAALSWTRDRQFVLLRQGGQRPDLVAVSIDGSRTIPIAQSPADETEGQFSPDGRGVAFVSHESGRPEVYLQAFPQAAGRTQVSTAGGTQVRWSADGREIFYLDPDGKMTAVRVAMGAGGPDVSPPVTLFQTYLATGGNVIGNKAQYAVARDGRFLINAAIETPSTPIVVTTNWQQTIKQ